MCCCGSAGSTRDGLRWTTRPPGCWVTPSRSLSGPSGLTRATFTPTRYSTCPAGISSARTARHGAPSTASRGRRLGGRIACHRPASWVGTVSGSWTTCNSPPEPSLRQAAGSPCSRRTTPAPGHPAGRRIESGALPVAATSRSKLCAPGANAGSRLWCGHGNHRICVRWHAPGTSPWRPKWSPPAATSAQIGSVVCYMGVSGMTEGRRSPISAATGPQRARGCTPAACSDPRGEG